MKRKKILISGIIINLIVVALVSMVLIARVQKGESLFGIFNNKRRAAGVNEQIATYILPKSISGSGFSNINDVKKTADDGYIIAGSFAGEADLNGDGTVDVVSSGDFDALVAKYDKNGNFQWFKNYGSSGTEEFTGVAITSDGGFVVSGYETTANFKDGFVIKFNASGNQVWKNNITGNLDDEIKDVVVLKSGDVAIVGRFKSQTLTVASGRTLTNTGVGKYDGFIACYDANGAYKWMTAIDGANNIEATSIVETSKGVVMAVNFTGSISVNGTTINSAGGQDAILIGYSTAGAYQWNSKIGGANFESIEDLSVDMSDNVIAAGAYSSTISLGSSSITVNSGSYTSALAVKYSSSGAYVSNYNFGRAINADNKLTAVVATEDGGMLVGGWFYKGADIDGNGTVDYLAGGDNVGDGIIIKLNKNSQVEWSRNITGTSFDEGYGVEQLNDGRYVVVGNFDSNTVSSISDSNILTKNGYNDSFMIAMSDENQTKELTYTVEYYKNGKKVEADSKVNSKTLNVLDVDELEINKSDINMSNKYTGYSFEKIEQNDTQITSLPDKVNTGTTIKVYYVANTYIVKYNGNGSTGGSTANSTHTYDAEKALTANGFTRSHTVTYNHNYTESTNTEKTATYTFKNWNTKADGTGTTYTNKQTVKNLQESGTFNLYAQWNSTSVEYVPTRTGYTFAGWYENANCTGTRVDKDGVYTPSENKTLYAKWTANTYTVKYNGNESTDGQIANSIHTYDVAKKLTTNAFERAYIVTYNHNYTGSTNTEKTATYTFKNWNTKADGTGTAYENEANVTNLTDNGIFNLYAQWNSSSVTYVPTRTGYTFAGWYENANCTGEKVDSNGEYTPSEDVTLYAKWIANIYTVTYDGNGSTNGTTESSSHTYDVNTNLTENGFTREYTVTYNHNYVGSTDTEKTAIYTFKNWNTQANGEGTSYTNEQSVRNLSSVDGDTVTLYAEWNSASATYVPTREGYDFAGWYEIADCTGDRKDTEGEYTPNKDITLYAKWVANTYTVTYDGNGATDGETSNSIHTYDVPSNLTENGYVRSYIVTYNHNYEGSSNITRTSNYTFNGWANEADGDVVYQNEAEILNLTSAQDEEIRLYAKWSPVSVEYVPVRTGYTFNGWYSDEACTKQVTTANNTSYTPSRNITLYAKWTANTYEVRYNGNEATNQTMANSSHTYDTAQALSKNNFERKYVVTYNHNYAGSTNTEKIAEYTFEGWSKLTNGETEFVDEQEVINLSITQGAVVDLYAQWKENSVSYIPTRIGYTFEGWYEDELCTVKVTDAENTEYTPSEDTTVYAKWAVNSYEYTVNYLEKETNKVLHTSKVANETFGTEVLAADEVIEIFGYKVNNSNDITVSEEKENNVINIYYIVDEEQTKQLNYTVEYYKDGNKVDEDTQIVEETVQVLHDNQIKVKQDEINIVDKYLGYRLEKLDPGIIPEKIESGSSIKVYYIVDDENTKTISYTVEYYKSDEKVETKTGTKTVQILEPDKLEVTDRENLAKNDRYFGYKLKNIELSGSIVEEIPEVVNNKAVIKVVYEIDEEQTKELNYTVEYYKNGQLVSEDTQIKTTTVQVLSENKLEVQDRENIAKNDKYFGYKLNNIKLVEKADGTESEKDIGTQVPAIVNHESIIRVNYIVDEEQTKELSYTVEYYKDGALVPEDTQIETITVQVLHDDTIEVTKEKINLVNKYMAFELDADTTGVIPETVNNKTVIKIYYVHNELKTGYKIEYYYNNVLDTSKTELVETSKDEVITIENIEEKVEAGKVNGYKLFTVLNAPLVADEDIFNINKNVIKVHYVTEVNKDPENPSLPVVEKTGYKVEYYYDNKIDNTKTEVVEVALGERINKETISNKIEINTTDGFKVATVLNAPLIVSSDVDNNVIKVHYIKISTEPTNPDLPVGPDNPEVPVETNETLYKIEYYYDNKVDTSKSEVIKTEIGEEVTRSDIEEKANKNNIEGFTLTTILNIPLTVSSNIENNVIKVHYRTIENPDIPEKDKTTIYKIEYYYDGELDTERTEVIEGKIGSKISKTAIYEKIQENKISGYKVFATSNVPLTIEENVENNVIKIHYVKDTSGENPGIVTKVAYKIEYYYDNEIDNSKSEVLETEVGKEITKSKIQEKIEKHTVEGYELFTLLNMPLVASEDSDNNVIKIHYRTIKPVDPENPNTETAYKIEYYYDKVIDTARSEIVEATIGQVIEKADIQEKITENEKEKYKLVATLNTPLKVLEDVENNVIKVHYEEVLANEDVKTNTVYKLEYYYDNKIDTTKSEIVDILIGNKVSKEEVEAKAEKNVKDGYRLVTISNVPLIAEENEDNNVIRIYYKTETKPTDPDIPVVEESAYKIEYYYNGTKNNVLTDVIDAKVNDTIYEETISAQIEENKPVECKSVTVLNTPLTVSKEADNNIIKVYYIVEPKEDEIKHYKIEYYYDNKINTEKTQDIEDIKGNVITEEAIKGNITTNVVDGYEFDRVENTPLVIGENEENNVIKIYYTKRTDLEFTIEYYYDGVKAEEKTVTETATFEDVIEEYEDKNITGYKFDKVENAPLTIGVNPEENIIRVYYVKDKFTYTVEYYYDGVKAEDETVTETATFEDVIEEYEDKNITGYKFDKVENAPLTIGVNPEENVIRVYYVKDKFTYTVEYYYDGVKAEEKTVTETATFEDVIEEYEDKNITGYKFDKVENAPLTVGVNPEENVIRVYYVYDETQTGYKIEYYYDNVINESKTELIIADIDEVITADTIKEKIENNNIDGYKLLTVLNVPLVADKDINKNVIKVHYKKITAKPVDPENPDVPVEPDKEESAYKIEYYYNGIRNNKLTDVIEAKVNEIVNEETINERVESNKPENCNSLTVLNTPLKITDQINSNIIKVYYVIEPKEAEKKNYTIEYYYDDEKDEARTDTIEDIQGNVIKEETISENIKENTLEGYKLDRIFNTPLVVDKNEEENIIKVYFVKRTDLAYRVEYYYDGEIDNDRTEYVVDQTYKAEITKYVNKDRDGYIIEKTENLPLTIGVNEEDNVIKVYYVRKESTVKVQYVDKYSKEEISEEVIKNGRVFDKFDVEEDKKDIEGYTLVESPEVTSGEFKEDEQVFTYYYAKNTQVTVKYLEKKLNEENAEEVVLAEETVVEGYEGKDYKVEAKEIANYTCVEDSKNTEGTMTRESVEVRYYYLQNTKVVVNHIDRNSGEILEKVEKDGLVGDKFTAVVKDFEGYVIVERPETEVVTMSKETITLNYYYEKVSAGVIEKHINVKTNEVLESKVHEGNEGTEYSTSPKEFEGYDLLEDRMPENASGTMTVETIEVKYYYIRRANVKVEYIDKITGENLAVETIEGHEGDEYSTETKEFANYKLAEVPENAKGEMKVTTKEDGTVNVETVVRYYYVYVSEGVTERHIDVKTNEVLEEVKHEGNEGETYETKAKEFEGYDLIEKPENATGTMTREQIIVEYKYIRKAVVKVEYIDKFTEENISEKVQETDSSKEDNTTEDKETFKDSTVVIEGHEGDKYETKAKEFENYKLVEVPENSTGEMQVERKEDGTVNIETSVKYYYVHISEGIVEKHIDVMTDENIEEPTIHEGYEGDSYETEAKEFEGYDLIEDKLPENAQGEMTVAKQEVRYYYIRKASVKVQYIDKDTNEKLLEDVIIEGHEKDRYTTEEKEIEGYKLVEKPENFEGEMKVERKDGEVETELVITYYYSKVKTPSEDKPNEDDNNDNNNNNNQGNNGGNTNNPNQNENNNNGANIGNNNSGNNQSNNSGNNANQNAGNNSNGNQNPSVIEKVYNYIVKDNNDGNTSSNKETITKLLTPGTGDILPQIALVVISLVILVNIIVVQIRKRKKQQGK